MIHCAVRASVQSAECAHVYILVPHIGPGIPGVDHRYIVESSIVGVAYGQRQIAPAAIRIITGCYHVGCAGLHSGCRYGRRPHSRRSRTPRAAPHRSTRAGASSRSSSETGPRSSSETRRSARRRRIKRPSAAGSRKAILRRCGQRSERHHSAEDYRFC